MKQNTDEFDYVYANFYSNKVVVYREPFKRLRTSKKELQDKINFEKKEYNGYMSPATRKYITKILDTWYLTTKHYNRYYSNSTNYSKKILTFVTLTLPCKQTHSDNEIKRIALNHFLTTCLRFGYFQYYYWRAEKQKNGNIHFHLIVDNYINCKQLQETWNKCLTTFGYIDEFEKKHGHRNPPTTHIQVIPPNEHIIDYVCKYVGKLGEEHKVDGRIWGMSDKLRNIIQASAPMDTQIETELNNLIDDKASNFFENDKCIIINVKKSDRQIYESRFRRIVLERFMQANCNYLYFDNDLPLNVLFEDVNNHKKKPIDSIVISPKWKQLEISFSI